VVLFLAASSVPSVEAKWGRTGSEIVDFTKSSHIKKVTNSPYVWIVALYRDGCGYCELLKPEFEKASGKMRKMVGFGAVDVVTHPHAAAKFQEEYNFKVDGVPTIVVFKPKPDGSRPERIIYKYERKSKAMVKFLSEQMPDYVARVTAGSYDTWEAKPGAKVVLFSKKKEAPSALKALSTKYRQRLSFGFVDEDDKKLAEKFGVKELPALFVVEKGKSVGNSDYAPLKYSKSSVTVTALEFFIMDHAVAKPDSDGGSGSDSGGEKKKEKKKDKPKDEKKTKEEGQTER